MLKTVLEMNHKTERTVTETNKMKSQVHRRWNWNTISKNYCTLTCLLLN